MPKRPSKSSKGFLGNYNSYPCRICKSPHPLRKCRKFLAMNMSDRISAVRKHKYCSNCLAHDHSNGTCFTKHGCRHCKKFHHTLLHVNPRLLKDILKPRSKTRSRSKSPISRPSTSSRQSRASKPRNISTASISKRGSSPSTSSKTATWTEILRQNTIILLPTVLVKLNTTSSHARCLLDSGSPVSRVSKNLVDKLGATVYTLNEETICPLVLKSRFDSTSKIEGTFRVDHRIAIHTPKQDLPE